MIADSLVSEIRDLLGQGELSQRAIARRFGVSHGTVNAIALGKRRGRSRRPASHDRFIPPTGQPVRCPGCGGLTQMPCLVCYLRSLPPIRRA